jgi:FkbM family methyltransferase
MRLREFFYLIGLKPNYQFYGHEIDEINVDSTKIEFANWLAPKSKKLVIEQNEVDELRQFLSDGDIAIDVGAHIGDSSLPIALACGRNGAVFAFEPNPLTFAVLAANSALNPKYTNIIPFPFAATANDCLLEFDYGDPWLSNGGDHTGVSKWFHGSAFSIPVNGKNISLLLRGKFAERLTKLRYIKIDVEGNDYSVVKALANEIQEFRPYLKLEVARPTSKEDRDGIDAFFKRHNYELRLVLDRKTLFGPPLTREHLYGEESIDIFAIPK